MKFKTTVPFIRSLVLMMATVVSINANEQKNPAATEALWFHDTDWKTSI